MRILFLDDDPARAASFFDRWPEAAWVETADECVQRLEEPWDEVHLDHDLGGETFVDHERDDCGMAVVRWICEGPRDHLRDTRFFIHTHNENAASMMALHLEVSGYRVEVRPFGRKSAAPAAVKVEIRPRSRSWARTALDWLIGKAMPRGIL